MYARTTACLPEPSFAPCNWQVYLETLQQWVYYVAALSLQIPSVPAAGKLVTSSTSRRSILVAGGSPWPVLSSCSVACFWKLLIRYNETRGFTDRVIRTVLRTYVNDAAAEFHHPANDSGGAVPASGDDDQFVVRPANAVSLLSPKPNAAPSAQLPSTWFGGKEEATWGDMGAADDISGDLISAFESHHRPPGLRFHFSSVANHALQVCSLRLVHLKYTMPPPPPPPQ